METKKYESGQIHEGMVTGIQPYGAFISFPNGQHGLVHISEISNDFIKDVSKVSKVGDIIYAKILDVDNTSKHLKLSIKATLPKTRYKSNYIKQKNDNKFSDFTPLEQRLNNWIIEQLKEKRNND